MGLLTFSAQPVKWPVISCRVFVNGSARIDKLQFSPCWARKGCQFWWVGNLDDLSLCQIPPITEAEGVTRDSQREAEAWTWTCDQEGGQDQKTRNLSWRELTFFIK